MSSLVFKAIRRNSGYSASNLCILSGNAAFVICRPLSSVKEAQGSDKRSPKERKTSFTVSYLVNSCGLSLESAKSRSQYVQLFSSDNPDSVLGLFRNYGFTDDQITKVVKTFPKVLVLDPENILLPKLEFLGSIGFSRDDTTKYISSCPKTLSFSLKNKLIPCYNFLKSVLNQDEHILKCMKRSHWMFMADLENNMTRKVSILRELGVPQSNLELLFTRAPRVFSCAPKRFDEILEKVAGYGFNPMKLSFAQAIIAFCQLRESSWERKIEVFKSCGWSEDEFSSAFKKYPLCMEYSEKKIVGVMDFLVNKIGLQPSDIARRPYLFGLSLEKRIVPRCLGIGVLLNKGFLKAENVNYPAILKLPEKQFLEKFVLRYQDDFPLLLSVVQGKTVPKELSCG